MEPRRGKGFVVTRPKLRARLTPSSARMMPFCAMRRMVTCGQARVEAASQLRDKMFMGASIDTHVLKVRKAVPLDWFFGEERVADVVLVRWSVKCGRQELTVVVPLGPPEKVCSEHWKMWSERGKHDHSRGGRDPSRPTLFVA